MVAGIAAEMGWDDAAKGLALSSFFYGYAPCHFLNSWLSWRFGPRRILTCAALVQGALALSFPSIVRCGTLFPVLLTRLLMGCTQAALNPCLMQLIGAWLPPNEASRGYGIICCGDSAGAALAFVLTPQLMHSYGWPATFYATGGASVAWACLAFRWLYDAPARHPRLVAAERGWLAGELRASATGMARGGGRVPWRALFCRTQVLCLPLVIFCTAWGWYVFLTFLPQYLHNQLNFNLNASGGVALLPYTSHLLGQLGAGVVADRMLEARHFTPTTVRRLFHSAGALGAAALLLGTAYARSAPVAVALITGSNFMFGLCAAGALVVPTSLSACHAGLLGGTAFGLGNMAGIVAPLVTGWVLESGHCPHDTKGRLPPITPTCRAAWEMVFLTSAGAFASAALIFTVFGSAEPLTGLGGAVMENMDGCRREAEEADAGARWTDPMALSDPVPLMINASIGHGGPAHVETGSSSRSP